MNKKGAVVAIIADYKAFFVFCIIAFAFFVILKIGFAGHAEYRVKSAEMWTYPQTTLQSYLRAPVDLQGQEITVEELIALSYNTNDYAKLDEKTNELFEYLDYFSLFICEKRMVLATREELEQCAHFIERKAPIADIGGIAKVSIYTGADQQIANPNPEHPELTVVLYLRT
jgi:hypothetical protein